MAWRHPTRVSQKLQLGGCWRGSAKDPDLSSLLGVRGDALYQNAKSRLALFPRRTGMCVSLLSAPRKRRGLRFLRNVCEKSAKEASKGMEENAVKAGEKNVVKVFY